MKQKLLQLTEEQKARRSVYYKRGSEDLKFIIENKENPEKILERFWDSSRGKAWTRSYYIKQLIKDYKDGRSNEKAS